MYIQDYAAHQCYKLEVINFELCSKLISIGIGAFSGYGIIGIMKISTIFIPPSVIEIKSHCFFNCALKNIIIPFESELQLIGVGAFTYFDPSTPFFIPKNLSFVISAFYTDGGDQYYCDYYNFSFIFHPECKYYSDGNFIYDKDNTTIYYSFNCHDLSIVPKTITTIYTQAFLTNCIERLVIPDHIKFLAPGAFAVSFIQSLELSNSIEEIPENCFYAMNNIKVLTIPESVKIIHKNAFKYCRAESIVIPKSIHRVYLDFENNLTILSNDITLIPNSGFGYHVYINGIEINVDNNRNLTYYYGMILDDNYSEVVGFFDENRDVMNIPKTVKIIRANAFKGFMGSHVYCDSGSELQFIEDNSFDSCSNLLNIPNSSKLETLGELAFKSCTKLNFIILPLSLHIIHKNTFSDCTIKCCRFFNKTNTFINMLFECRILSSSFDICFNICQKCNTAIHHKQHQFGLHSILWQYFFAFL